MKKWEMITSIAVCLFIIGGIIVFYTSESFAKDSDNSSTTGNKSDTTTNESEIQVITIDNKYYLDESDILSAGTSNDICLKIFKSLRNEKNGYMKELVSTINGNANEVITKIYDLENLAFKSGVQLGVANIYLSRVDPSLYGSNLYAPLEYLHMIDDDYLYSVNKTQNDGGQIVYLYRFFKKTKYENNQEFWSSTEFALYAVKKLSSSDFSKIKTGSFYEDVLNIDPATYLYMNTTDPDSQAYKDYVSRERERVGDNYVEPLEEFSSYHLLTDGVIKIDYKRDSNGKYIVSNIEKVDSIKGDKCSVDSKDLPQ